MTDHKFTDEEIIKALEVHSDSETPCTGVCPYSGDRYCGSKMARGALALINRQKAEIERLQAVHADMTESLRLASEANKDMSVELDAMRGAANSYKMHYENAKAEAIKEFAERLKFMLTPYPDGYFKEPVTSTEIDNLVKEMTEDNNESQNT